MNIKFNTDKDEDGENLRAAAIQGLLNPDGIVEGVKTLLESLKAAGYRATKVYRRGDGYVRAVLSPAAQEESPATHA